MTHFIAGDEPIVFAEEMELRDYFAAKAMQGIISLLNGGAETLESVQEQIAEDSYQIADKMIKERNK